MKPDVSPTVRATVEAVRGRIRSGTFRLSTPLPPETQLAAILGVSRGTIRRAIEVLVGTGELKRRPYSRPTIEARSSGSVALGSEVHVWISHPIADGASLQFMKGISAGLKGTNYRLVVREPARFYADFVKLEEREFLNAFLYNDNAAGAIIERDTWARNEDLYGKIIGRGKCLVFADVPAPEGLDADHVGTANVAAARRCVGHLLEIGHSQIAFVTDSDLPQTIQDRMKGYERAMKQAGLAEEVTIMVADKLEPTGNAPRMQLGGAYARILSKSATYSEWAQRAVRDLLAMDRFPSALFVSCDVMAYWVGAYLEGSGVRIPDDLAMVGFDWLGRWDDPANDILTSASQDFEGFGMHAVELLLDRISDGLTCSPRHVQLQAPLVIRASTIPDATAVSLAAELEPPRLFR